MYSSLKLKTNREFNHVISDYVNYVDNNDNDCTDIQTFEINHKRT